MARGLLLGLALCWQAPLTLRRRWHAPSPPLKHKLPSRDLPVTRRAFSFRHVFLLCRLLSIRGALATARLAGHRVDVRVGDVFSCAVQCTTVRCTVSVIAQRMDRRTGLVAEYSPASLGQGDFGTLVLVPLGHVWCENYSAFPALGRLSAMDDTTNSVCFVGVVKNLEVCSDNFAVPLLVCDLYLVVFLDG